MMLKMQGHMPSNDNRLQSSVCGRICVYFQFYMSTVKRRLGHTKVSTTFDNYVHALPGMQEKAAAVMDEITTPVALPADLTAPKLHQESDARNDPD